MKKKKKLFLGILIFILVVFFMNVVIFLMPEMEEENTLTKKGEEEATSLTCTYKDKDDISFSFVLDIQEGKLITKTEETTWEDKEEDTCAFYTKRVEIYNTIEGIEDSVTCDATKGSRKTVYTFETLDTREANISELKYIDEDGYFDYDSYKAYREGKGYHCELK